MVNIEVGKIGLNMVLNSAQFKQQLQGVRATANNASSAMSASFKKLAGVVGAAFSVTAIVGFTKKATEAANVQLEAETKLTTIMRQRMKASDSAVNSIKAYTSEQQKLGVIGDEVQLAGSQQLATFLNTDNALKTLIPAMNNLAAQQNGVNATSSDMVNIGNLMGKVMQGQTAALTRVGITFSEAEEKVLKYGNEQERAAMLAKVITNNVGDMNSALANTPAGKIQRIKNNLGDIFETMGRAVNNILTPCLSVIEKMVSKLSQAVSLFEDFTKNIFGDSNQMPTSGMSTVSDDAQQASESIDNVSDSAEKAKHSLAGFDKLNVLNNTQSDNTSTNSNAQNDISALNQATKSAENAKNNILKTFSNLYEKSGFKGFVSNIQKGIDKVNWKSIGENCKSIFKNLVPISKTYLTELQKFVSAKIKAIGSAIGFVITVGGKIFQTLTGGIAKWLEKDGKKIQDFITSIGTHLENGWNNISELFDKLGTVAGDSIDRMRDPLEESISNLLSGLTTFAGSIGEVISGAFEIATGSLVSWIDNDGATIGEFFDNLQAKISEFQNFWGGVFEDLGATISDWWNGEDGGAVMFQNVCDMFTSIGTTLMNVYNEYISPAITWIVSMFQSAWDNWLSPVFSKVLKFFGKLIGGISEIWNTWLGPFVNWLISTCAPYFKNALATIGNVFTNLFTTIGGVVGGIVDYFSGLIDFVTGTFTGNWKKAWNGIKDTTRATLDILKSILRGAFNVIIDLVNTLWTGIYSAVSSIVNSIGGLAKIIGKALGQDWGWTMPSQPPLIPHLAKGGLVKAPTLAVVGDNAGANNGNPEVVAPLSKLEGMINSSNGSDVIILSQILDLLKRIYEMFVVFKNKGGNSYEFIAQLNGSAIFNEVVRQNNLYKNRHNGKSALS